MTDKEFEKFANKLADSPVVREFTGSNMSKYILIAQKGQVSHILAEAGFNNEEILQIIGNLTEENSFLARRLIAKEIKLSVFLWKVVWFSQSKKFDDMARSNEKVHK